MIKIGWATRNVATTDRVGILGQFYQRISRGFEWSAIFIWMFCEQIPRKKGQ